ncbi:hypothetical protein [uncultured Senegalimassilia sp.]|nr:hypothetical protein [uncultured Senegalimassilia sp.]
MSDEHDAPAKSQDVQRLNATAAAKGSIRSAYRCFTVYASQTTEQRT